MADNWPAAAGESRLGSAELLAAGGVTRLSNTTRVESFSDGVMAIAITLLVLDVRLPTDGGSVLHQLVGLWPSYLAYADSFATIGVIWLCHHAFFGRLRYVDGLLQLGNLALLMTVAFLPFPTSVLGAHFAAGGRGARVATAFYGLVAMGQAAAWLIMWAAVRKRPQLLEPGFDAAFVRSASRLGWLGLAVFGLCALIGLLAPIVSLTAYVAAIAGYGITSNGGKAFRRATTLTCGAQTRGSVDDPDTASGWPGIG